jgi:hypothetical protein
MSNFIDSKDKGMVQPPHGLSVPGQCNNWLTILVWSLVRHSFKGNYVLSVTPMARMSGS